MGHIATSRLTRNGGGEGGSRRESERGGRARLGYLSRGPRLPSYTTARLVAPPGFCNRGEVKYGYIGGLQYEVPQSRLYCLCINYQRGSLLDGLAMYLSCDTKKFHDNESTHILHNF